MKMSSIVEKSTTLEEKRSFFLRRSSFQKLKCSATYPFRLAGTKLSKDAIKQLIETLIMKARILSQKALLILYIIGIWVSESAKQIRDGEICDKKKTNSTLSFRERILMKIHKLQIHKKKIEQKNVELIETSKKQTTELLINEKLTENVSEFHAEIEKFRKYSIEFQVNKLNRTKMSTENLNNNNIVSLKHNKNSLCLTLFVHACIVFIYLQLLFLTFALNTTQIPPGLIFLITSLLLIAFIVFKVFCIRKINKLSTKKLINDSTNERTLEQTQKNTRQSRSRTRKFVPTIDLTSKTLSKIKLL